MANFKPQKVLSLKTELEKKNPKLQGNFLVTTKYEGWYVSIAYTTLAGWSCPVSSNSRTIPSMEWTRSLFSKLPVPKEDCFLIAEAYLEDTPFHILNGIFNTSKGACSCLEVQFKLHDIIYPNNPSLTAIERYNRLGELDLHKIETNAQIVPILYSGIYDSKEWQRHFEVIANRGGEGIVAKRDTSIYMAGKRNSDLLKLKLELTVDCLAVALEETVGDKGNSGLVLVSRRKNGVLVRTVIGKHVDQDLFRKDSSNVIGKVVQVKAMEEYADGQLRQPVFQHVRHDKLTTEIN